MLRSKFFFPAVAITFFTLANVHAQTPTDQAPIVPAVGDSTPAPTPQMAVSGSSSDAFPTEETIHSQQIRFSEVHVDGKYIAMTFDDGPSAANTPRLLKILADRHIHATFFLIGQNAARYPDIVRAEYAAGHEIGNHTWTHPQLSKLTSYNVQNEILKTQDAIEKAIGKRPTLLRPPYGALTPFQRAWIHYKYGYSTIMWAVDPLDWKHMPGESPAERTARVEREILKQVRPGYIILSHDIHATTVDAMADTLDKLLAQGYKFVTVSELINMAKPEPPKPAAKGSPLAKKAATAN